MNNETVFNPIKKKESPDATVFNPGSGSVVGDFLKEGDLLGDFFRICGKIDKAKTGGEADLYLAKKESSECDGSLKNYVVKVFRRDMDEESLPAKRLKNLDSKRIAKIYASGEIYDKYYEIYEYFERGSLADSLRERTFTEEELTERIIPNLNEALHDLHENGVLHRDIKPGNIMWSNEEKDGLVLIDFGLSSSVRESKSIVVSQIGFTASYAAPEVLRNVYFDESDYYSMGIVIYELFTGKTPFGEENSYTSVIAKPGNMPERIYRLILGLTYQDLSYRHDLSNPNRRWTYEEVKKWLKGEELPTPGLSGNGEEAKDIPPISFCGREYTDIESLSLAMGYHWEEGKNLLLTGQLVSHLRYGRTATDRQRFYASVIEDGMNEKKLDADARMENILYHLSPDLNVIVCPMGVYDSVAAWAEALFAALFANVKEIRFAAVDTAEALLKTGILSRIAERNKEKAETIRILSGFERRAQSKDWFGQREKSVYELAYLITDHTEYDPGLPDGTVFRNAEQLKQYLMQDPGENYSKLYLALSFFLDGEHKCKPSFYGWLKGRGYDLPGFE